MSTVDFCLISSQSTQAFPSFLEYGVHWISSSHVTDILAACDAKWTSSQLPLGHCKALYEVQLTYNTEDGANLYVVRERRCGYYHLRLMLLRWIFCAERFTLPCWASIVGSGLCRGHSPVFEQDGNASLRNKRIVDTFQLQNSIRISQGTPLIH